jgi:hypothetical protein
VEFERIRNIPQGNFFTPFQIIYQAEQLRFQLIKAKSPGSHQVISSVTCSIL